MMEQVNEPDPFKKIKIIVTDDNKSCMKKLEEFKKDHDVINTIQKSPNTIFAFYYD